MSKKFKIALIAFTMMVVGAIGLFAFISSKIKPEEIRKLTLEILNKQLPKANSNIEVIDYSIGTSVRLYVKNFNMTVKENNDPLINVGEVEVKIPLLAILTTGGGIEINVKNPKIDYLGYAQGANWLNILPESAPTKEASEKKDSEELKLPEFISKSKIDVRFEGIDLNYKPFQAAVSNINVSRILIKDINLETTTAFEVASVIDFNLSETRNIKLDLLVVGQTNIGKFLKEKKLEASVVTNLKDIKISDLDFSIPNVKNILDVQIDEAKTITLSAKTELESLGDINANVKMLASKVNVNDLVVKINLSNAVAILPKELQKNLNIIDLGTSEFELKGAVDLDLETKKMSPNLNFKISDSISVKSVEGVNLNNKISGEYANNKASLNIITELLEGVITTKVNTDIDVMNANFSPNALPPVFVDIEGSNLKVKKSYLQSLIYGKKKTEEAKPEEDVKPKVGSPVTLPTTHVSIKFNHFMIADEVFELDAKIHTGGQRAYSEKFQFNFSKGLGVIGFNTHLIDTANIKNAVHFKMTALNLNAFNSFLPPILSGVGGTFDGKVDGELNLLSKGLNYDFKVDVQARDGEFKDLDLAKYIMPLVEGVPQLKGKVTKNDLILSDKFEKLVLLTDASSKLINLKKFDFIGAPNTADMNGKGQVFMSDKEDSEVFLTFKDKSGKLSTALAGRKDIPMRLAGKGFIILPDIKYTLGIIAGGALKAEAAKQTKVLKDNAKKEMKKAEAKAKKEVEKAKDKAKSEAEKYLKGMFKK
jgi:hypothetical protein